jgi:hypothetical protein
MGSTNSKRPAASEEMKYLSPTGLYPSCNWDLKTIRKLIIEKKLAPFYPGREEKDSPELDECPICFMFYAGGLNRTKCCHKGVCTGTLLVRCLSHLLPGSLSHLHYARSRRRMLPANQEARSAPRGIHLSLL